MVRFFQIRDKKWEDVSRPWYRKSSPATSTTTSSAHCPSGTDTCTDLASIQNSMNNLDQPQPATQTSIISRPHLTATSSSTMGRIIPNSSSNNELLDHPAYHYDHHFHNGYSTSAASMSSVTSGTTTASPWKKLLTMLKNGGQGNNKASGGHLRLHPKNQAPLQQSHYAR